MNFKHEMSSICGDIYFLCSPPCVGSFVLPANRRYPDHYRQDYNVVTAPADIMYDLYQHYQYC